MDDVACARRVLPTLKVVERVLAVICACVVRGSASLCLCLLCVDGCCVRVCCVFFVFAMGFALRSLCVFLVAFAVFPLSRLLLNP